MNFEGLWQIRVNNLNKFLGESELEVGEIQKDIEIINTHTRWKLLEAETKHMKSMANLNEDINERLNSVQDQVCKSLRIQIF